MDMASLPKAAELASTAARNPRWHPGAVSALHSEIFASADDAGGTGAVLALASNALEGNARKQRSRAETALLDSALPDSALPDSGAPDAALEERAVLWVQDKQAIRRSGRPYRPGLPAYLRDRIIHVAAQTPEDALFALEEGVRCRELACVIGEIAGNPRALDFTASRRLSLAAEKHGVPLYLLRIEARADLSSARMRWQVRSAPSAPPLWDRGAPGRPTWHAELFRSRSHSPGEWILRDDDHALSAERYHDVQTASENSGSKTSGPKTSGPETSGPETSGTPDHGDMVRTARA